jgi:protein-tyrosine-phosphatase
MRADWSATILFVCTGNTCRSPMAAGLAERRLQQLGAPHRSLSAGIAAAAGAPASELARRAAAEAGLDLASHRARQLVPAMLEEASLVLVMTPEQRQAAVGLAPAAAGRVHLLCDYATGTAGEAVPDPFGSDLETYRRTLAQIDALVGRVLERFLAEAESPRS